MIDVGKEIKCLELHLAVLLCMIPREQAREWFEISLMNLMDTEEGKKYLERKHD